MTVHELPTRGGARRRPRARVELALLGLLYAGYSLARLLGDADLGAATSHAQTLLRVEHLLGLDVEAWANRMLTSLPVLPVAASFWYASLHYLVTPAVLVWAYRSRPAQYRLVRDALVIGSAVGLIGFTVLPMAPPRMLPGFVDTLVTTSGYGWWGADASAPEGMGHLTNELAAMPSLHVGWAVWCAWVVVRLAGSRWSRATAVGYAAVTTLVVVATANHYVLDAVAGAAVIALGVHAARRLHAPGRRVAARRQDTAAAVCTACAGHRDDDRDDAIAA